MLSDVIVSFGFQSIRCNSCEIFLSDLILVSEGVFVYRSLYMKGKRFINDIVDDNVKKNYDAIN